MALELKHLASGIWDSPNIFAVCMDGWHDWVGRYLLFAWKIVPGALHTWVYDMHLRRGAGLEDFCLLAHMPALAMIEASVWGYAHTPCSLNLSWMIPH